MYNLTNVYWNEMIFGIMERSLYVKEISSIYTDIINHINSRMIGLNVFLFKIYVFGRVCQAANLLTLPLRIYLYIDITTQHI